MKFYFYLVFDKWFLLKSSQFNTQRFWRWGCQVMKTFSFRWLLLVCSRTRSGLQVNQNPSFFKVRRWFYFVEQTWSLKAAEVSVKSLLVLRTLIPTWTAPNTGSRILELVFSPLSCGWAFGAEASFFGRQPLGSSRRLRTGSEIQL